MSSALEVADPTSVDQPSDVLMYSTDWCGYCHRLKAQMTREGITYTEVDIEADPVAAAYVESVNDGAQTVPTIVLGDGSAHSNPSIGRVKELLGR